MADTGIPSVDENRCWYKRVCNGDNPAQYRVRTADGEHGCCSGCLSKMETEGIVQSYEHVPGR